MFKYFCARPAVMTPLDLSPGVAIAPLVLSLHPVETTIDVVSSFIIPSSSFEYVTNNLYTETLTYNFEIMESFTKTLNANLGVTPDEENGRFCINLSVYVMPEEDTVMIRRASSKDNYLT